MVEPFNRRMEVTPIGFAQARHLSSKLNMGLIIVLVAIAIVLELMNLQAFVWWRKAKHSTCWVSFNAIVNCIMVSRSK